MFEDFGWLKWIVLGGVAYLAFNSQSGQADTSFAPDGVMPLDDGGGDMPPIDFSSSGGLSGLGAYSPTVYKSFGFWAEVNYSRYNSRTRRYEQIGNTLTLINLLRAPARVIANVSFSGFQGQAVVTVHVEGYTNVAGIGGGPNGYRNYVSNYVRNAMSRAGFSIRRTGFSYFQG